MRFLSDSYGNPSFIRLGAGIILLVVSAILLFQSFINPPHEVDWMGPIGMVTAVLAAKVYQKKTEGQ